MVTVCSATAIATKMILSASHCFTHSTTTIRVNDTFVTIKRLIRDDNDHVILVLDGIEFEHVATLNKPLTQGENIHYWGNPDGLDMQYRKGYVSGRMNDYTTYDVTGYHGDSGAGIFNDRGELIGVISVIYQHDSFSMMASKPFNFKHSDLQSIGILTNQYLISGKFFKSGD